MAQRKYKKILWSLIKRLREVIPKNLQEYCTNSIISLQKQGITEKAYQRSYREKHNVEAKGYQQNYRKKNPEKR